MPDPISTDHPHSEAEELLPWYATGQLDARDRDLVETHLSSCEECRRQLALERRLVSEFRASSPQTDAGWARLRARIEGPSNVHSLVARATGGFRQAFSQPGVALLAAAQAGFLIFGGAVLLSLSRPAYHALGSAPAPTSANMIVMFRPDARAREINAALKTSGASLVGGPTATDAYMLSVPAAVRPRALARLQSSAAVAMAQPIDGPTR
jgi:hypothetical protein